LDVPEIAFLLVPGHFRIADPARRCATGLLLKGVGGMLDGIVELTGKQTTGWD